MKIFWVFHAKLFACKICLNDNVLKCSHMNEPKKRQVDYVYLYNVSQFYWDYDMSLHRARIDQSLALVGCNPPFHQPDIKVKHVVYNKQTPSGWANFLIDFFKDSVGTCDTAQRKVVGFYLVVTLIFLRDRDLHGEIGELLNCTLPP